MDEKKTDGKPGPGKNSLLRKLIFVGIFGAIAAILYWQFGSQLSLESLAERETDLRAYQSQHPVLVFGIAFLIYVTVTGMSMPGAAVLTLMYGWYFGFAEGLFLVSFASTLGATIAFLTSRYPVSYTHLTLPTTPYV